MKHRLAEYYGTIEKLRYPIEMRENKLFERDDPKIMEKLKRGRGSETKYYRENEIVNLKDVQMIEDEIHRLV